MNETLDKPKRRRNSKKTHPMGVHAFQSLLEDVREIKATTMDAHYIIFNKKQSRYSDYFVRTQQDVKTLGQYGWILYAGSYGNAEEMKLVLSSLRGV